MTISVVQSKTASASSVTLTSAVTAGSTLFVAVAAYGTGGSSLTATAPTLGGSSVPGTVALFNSGGTNGVNSGSAGGNVAFITLWMLPNCPGGSTVVAGSTNGNTIEIAAYEVSGLGTAPVLDQSSSGSGTTTATYDSGTTGATTSASEFVFGASMIFSGVGAGAPAGFTNANSGDLWAGYQIASSSGSTYDWQQAQAGGGAPWAAAVATIKPGAASYRLFPSTNGPASATAYSGNFISGLVFAINGDNTWFEGYWWWVATSGQSTSPVKCALWATAPSGGGATGEVVPGSVVTSGTLTAGQWNYIPLATPVQLSRGYSPNISAIDTTCYIAAIGCNGAFPDTNNFWGSAIDSGPLHAYDGAHQGAAGGPPGDLPQGCFSTGGTDPSTTMPESSSGTDNFWVDVQVSDVAPSYSGSYRLYPNQINANNATTGDAAVNYTIATEIHLSQSCTLDNVWYFSPAGATTLATRADVWNISTGLSVATITSPSWKTDTGAAFTAGSQPYGSLGTWIKAAFAGGTTLPAGSYRVSVFNSNGTSDANWSAKDAGTDFWGETSGGAGYQGITWGPLYAPNWSGASTGYNYNSGDGGATPPYSDGTTTKAQPPFGQNPGGTIQFPQLYAVVNTDQSQNYWVDLEVTPPSSGESGAFSVSLPKPQLTLAGKVGHTGSLAVSLLKPILSLAGTVTHQGSLAVSLLKPVTALAGKITHQGSLSVSLLKPSLSLSGVVTRKGSLTIALPLPAVALTGTVTPPGHTGIFSIALPVPVTALSGKITHSGTFSLSLPELSLSLAGTISGNRSGTFSISLPVLITNLHGTNINPNGILSDPDGLGGTVTVPLYGGTVYAPNYAGKFIT